MNDAATMTPEDAIDRYARHGDAEAFALLVRRYHRVAYAAASRKLARREDVEDATQQAFINLARAAGTVRRDVAAWLYRAAQHAAIDLVRRDATRRRHESAINAIEPGESPDAAAWRELSQAMDDAIAALPDAERSLVVEHFLAGRSQAGLAASLGVNQATISRRLAAAVERLRDDLARRGHASIGAAAIAAELPLLGAADVPAGVAAELTKVGLAAPAEAAAAPLAMKVAIVTAVLLAVVGGGVALLTALAAPPTPPPPPALAAVATTPSAGTPDADYGLPAGIDLKVIAPPSPTARSAVLAPHPSPPDLKGADGVGFGFDGRAPRLAHISYASVGVAQLLEVQSGLIWHQHDATAIRAIGWPPRTADWVVRDGLTPAQRVAAVARAATEATGRDVRFELRPVRRPCVVLRGKPRDVPAGQGFGTVLVTAAPGDNVRQSERATGIVKFDEVCRELDAPFQPDGADVGALGAMTTQFWVEPDARLSRGDPDYRAKLRRVLDNLARQVGGTWTIEDRDVETWVAVVAP